MSEQAEQPAAGATASLMHSVASLLLGYALLMIGNSLANTQTSLGLLADGVPVAMAGVIQSAYYAGFFIGGFAFNGMVRVYGHHRAFAVLAAVVCLVALAQSLLHGQWIWLLSRFCNGLSICGVFMVVESWLNARVSNAQRGQLFALYMIITYLGASAGQWMLRLPFSQPGWQFIVVAMLFTLAIVPVTLTREQPPDQQEAVADSAWRQTLRALLQLNRRAPLGWAGALVAGCFNSSFYAMMPVLLAQLHHTPERVGDIMGLALLSAPLLQWPMGKWADQGNRAELLSRSALAVLVVALLLSQLLSTWLLVPLNMLLVCIAFTFYSTLSGIVNDAMPPHRRVEANAVLLMLYALGGTLGPLLCSLFMSWLGPSGYFVLDALLAAGMLAAARIFAAVKPLPHPLSP
ncbi:MULTISPECIES: MFS transporter [unclassified Paludibacterium]|uniref:MFS transporter n=1 Tax=unclassified Paludibacterium TaxID=2618429 RepID=UPI001C050751|nr:MFS transporter [Paludibacterium sp. B53371]BEV72699.1 MFS transporter [Paludibacterium sp. THUN1379]